MQEKSSSLSLITSIIFLVFWMFHGLLVTHKTPLNAVVDAGYGDVEFVESHWFLTSWVGCTPLYATGVHVKATNLKGERVSLLACSDVFFKETQILHRK